MAETAGTQLREARIRPWFGTTARLVVGAVFVVAGSLKLPDPAAAERAVRAYRLVPEALVPSIAFGLPALEICVGILLLVGVLTRPAAVSAGVLLAVFSTAVSSAWARGLSIDCGCFGNGGVVAPDQTAYLSELLRDVGLFVLAVYLTVQPMSRLALVDRAGRLERSPGP